MTRPSPFAACIIAMEMGVIPEDPEGMTIVRKALESRKNGEEKVYESKRAAERNQQLIIHHRLLVKLEKR